MVAPDRADELIARALAREETEARRTTYLRTWEDGQGSLCGRFKIPLLPGAMLTKAVAACANPDRPHPIPREGAATPQVSGLAFCELLERYPTQKLPRHGGINATVIVTMTLDTLEGRLRAGGILGTGHRLSPGQLRRLACQAGVIPVVLGGRSQVVDVAVTGRSFTPPQRLAMTIDQGGLCNITGCDRPGVHAHHRQAWSQGGKTSRKNGEMLCWKHHTLVHQDFHYPRRT